MISTTIVVTVNRPSRADQRATTHNSAMTTAAEASAILMLAVPP